MKKYRSYFLFILLLFIISCTEKDEFFDLQVEEQSHKEVILEDLYPNRHVAGLLTIDTRWDTLPEKVRKTYLYVDSTLYTIGGRYLSIETDYFSEGSHTISIGYAVESSKLGLLNLYESPKYIYSFPLIFDQTPPTPVVLKSVKKSEGGYLLEWEKNKDKNFYCYIITRSTYRHETKVDSVFDQNQTTYLDTDVPELYGERVGNYTLEVSNRAVKKASEAPIQYYDYGIKIRYYFSDYNPAVNSDQFIFFDGLDDAIYVFDSNKNQRVGAISNFDIGGHGLRVIRIYPSRDNKDLLILGTKKDFSLQHPWEQWIVKVDMSTLNIKASYLIPPNQERNMYLDVSPVGTTKLYANSYLIDYVEQKFLDTLSILNVDQILASPSNKNWLYFRKGSEITLVEEENGKLKILKQANVAIHRSINSIKIDQTGKKLYGMTRVGKIAIIDAMDLTFEKEIGLTFGEDEVIANILDFAIGSRSVYVSYSNRMIDFHKVVELNIETNEKVDEWEFLNSPAYLHLSPDEKHLYTNEGGTFIKESIGIPLD